MQPNILYGNLCGVVIGLLQKRLVHTFCLLVATLLLIVSNAAATENEPHQKLVWLVIGDSISEHNLAADHNYDEYAIKILDLDVINVAVGVGVI